MCDGNSPIISIRKCICDSAILEASAKVYVDGSLFFLQFSPDHCNVSTLNSMFKKLFCKMSHRNVCFCNDEQSGSVFVDTMHQTWPAFSILMSWKIAKVIC